MTQQEMIAQQNALRGQIVLHNVLDIPAVRTVAGIDLAYWEENGEEYGVCCVVVLERESRSVVASSHHSGRIAVPYIPGLLAFREMPLVQGAMDRLEVEPDILLFDGNGYLHPRRMGLATQAAILLGKPSVGVAKSFYRVGDANFVMPGEAAGSCTDIVVDGEVCGRVLRTHDSVRPVFVSVGNGLDLDTATRLTLELVDGESHIPVPTRLADLATHEMRARLRGRSGELLPYGDHTANPAKF